MEEYSTPLRRNTWQKWAPPPYHICNHEIRRECSENWDENSHSPQRICSACKIYFLDWKKHGCPSEFISQMVTYLHADSHIKPRRVKMHMQMRETEKNKRHHSGHFCFCLGQELVREAAVSLKRQRRRELLNTERRFFFL